MRNKAIDILRGLGILTIIFIHVTSWYQFDPTARFIWNWGQFAVPVFVFCSTYLFFIKKLDYQKDGFLNYTLKRLRRLLVPYYVFLAFYYLIFLIKDPRLIVGKEVLQSITLTSPGQQINWAVLLFVYMFLITLFLIISWQKSRVFFVVFSVLSVFSSVLFLSYSWPFNYKTIMWLPWSLMILFSWVFAKFEKGKFFYPLTILGTGGLFVVLYLIKVSTGQSLTFFSNKYPPNLYYLSYGMFGTALVYWLSTKNVFKPFEKAINYLSLHSYNIFFIHLWLVVAFSQFTDIRRFVWWQLFLIILLLTLSMQFLIMQMKSLPYSFVHKP